MSAQPAIVETAEDQAAEAGKEDTSINTESTDSLVHRATNQDRLRSRLVRRGWPIEQARLGALSQVEAVRRFRAMLCACIDDAEFLQIVEVLKQRAMKGHRWAVTLVLAYAIGKPVAPVDMTSDGEPIRLIAGVDPSLMAPPIIDQAPDPPPECNIRSDIGLDATPASEGDPTCPSPPC